jgi:hypothetical protein
MACVRAGACMVAVVSPGDACYALQGRVVCGMLIRCHTQRSPATAAADISTHAVTHTHMHTQTRTQSLQASADKGLQMPPVGSRERRSQGEQVSGREGGISRHAGTSINVVNWGTSSQTAGGTFCEK